MNWFKNKFSENYVFDVRAFALFRILFAFVMLLDVCIRISDLTAFYTQEGILPFSLLTQHLSKYLFLPIYQLNDSALYIGLCFAIHILAVFCFGFGFKTKFFQVVLLLFYISLHMRNPYILQGGDDLIRCMLFFSLFLPLNAIWAIEIKTVTLNFKIPALAFMFQVLMVYWVSALMKTSDEWHGESTALYYAFNLDCMQWPLAKYLLNFPELLKVLTRVAYYIELVIPFVFFIPFKNSLFRIIGIIILLVFQLFIASTIFVGLFYLINIVALVALLPPSIFNYFKLKNLATQTDLKTSLSIVDYTVAVCIGFIILWNCNYIPQVKYGLTKTLKSYAFVFGLNQSWGMFAPNVFKDDGWFVYEAITTKNDTIDLNNNGNKADYNKPNFVLNTIKNDRWRKYNEFLIMKDKAWLRPTLHNFLKKEALKKDYFKGKEIKELNLWFMKELTPAPSQTDSIVKINLLN